MPRRDWVHPHDSGDGDGGRSPAPEVRRDWRSEGGGGLHGRGDAGGALLRLGRGRRLRRCVWLGRSLRLSGRLRGRWRRVRVELVDELYIKDQVGLGRDYRATLFSISELVGNEETALAAHVHTFETL